MANKGLKIFGLLFICLIMGACSQSSKLKSYAKKQMEQTFKEIAKDPSSVKLSDEDIVYNDDSLCIIHVNFSAKNGLGADVKYRFEYVFIHSNNKEYEGFQQINDEEDGVFVAKEKYAKSKNGKIFENLSYEEGLHYLAAVFVNTEGREAGNKEGSFFNIPVPTGTGSWEINSYTDEFGEKGAVKYLVIQGIGVFSNSATTDSRMTAVLFVDKSDAFSLRLIEYDSNIVKSDDYYDVRVKDNDGQIYEWVMSNDEESGQMTTNTFFSDRTDSELNQTMQKILNKGGVVTFAIKERNAYSTPDTYLFKINVTGYKKAKSLL